MIHPQRGSQLPIPHTSRVPPSKYNYEALSLEPISLRMMNIIIATIINDFTAYGSALTDFSVS
jgi:hypothetical protein